MPALRPLAVDVVGQGLHVRETLVGVDHAPRVARLAAERRVGGARFHRPAIINVHVLVAVIHHAAADHRVGGGAHDLVGHVAFPHIPTVPAHVRRQRQRFAADDLEPSDNKQCKYSLLAIRLPTKKYSISRRRLAINIG